MYKNGFTMVEMIVVVGIAAILLATLVPVIGHYLPGVQLSGATRTLTGDLRESQEKAVTEQDQYLIRFFPNESPAKYQMIKIHNSVEEQIREEFLPNGFILALDPTITDNQVVFSPDGGPSASGNITLSISANQKIISVSPAGFIKIEQ